MSVGQPSPSTTPSAGKANGLAINFILNPKHEQTAVQQPERQPEQRRNYFDIVMRPKRRLSFLEVVMNPDDIEPNPADYMVPHHSMNLKCGMSRR